MPFNFLPKEIIETRDSNGKKYVSDVYSTEAWGNLGCLGISIVLFIIALFLPFISVVLLIYYGYTIFRDNRLIPLLAISSGVYTIIDMKKHWLLHSFTTTFFSVSIPSFVASLAGSAILLGGLILFFGDILCTISGKKSGTAILFIIGFTLFLNGISDFILNDIFKINW